MQQRQQAAVYSIISINSYDWLYSIINSIINYLPHFLYHAWHHHGSMHVVQYLFSGANADSMYVCMYNGQIYSKSMDQPGNALPILPVVRWIGKRNISLSAFAPENLVSRTRRVRQSHPASACSCPYSGWTWWLLTGFIPSSAAASIYLFVTIRIPIKWWEKRGEQKMVHGDTWEGAALVSGTTLRTTGPCVLADSRRQWTPSVPNRVTW